MKLTCFKLSHLRKRLARDPVLETRSNCIIEDMWDNDIIEEMPREESVGCGIHKYTQTTYKPCEMHLNTHETAYLFCSNSSTTLE